MSRTLGRPSFYLLPSGTFSESWSIFRRCLVSVHKNNALGLAKAAAYSALLAFFPVLTALTAMLVKANADWISRSLSSLIFEVVPPGTEDIVRYNFTQRGRQPAYLLVLATVLALWAASGIMITLMQGFQKAYRSPSKRSFWKERGVAALLVIYAVMPIILASALIVIGSRAENLALRWIGVLPQGAQLRGWVSLMAHVLRYLIAFGALVLGTCMLYHFGPEYKTRWRNVWPGALITTVLWLLTTMIFAWYVRNIANYNVLYGSIGAVVALLVWMYLLSAIALVGCEYNAERERSQGPGFKI